MLESRQSLAAPAPAIAPAGVLVVDDIEANLVALRALLRDLDCNITLARSGNEALRCLLKSDFAVMLLDVQMPEMDGYEVARHARANARARDVPIIFVTATHDTESNILEGYGSGAVDFLFKPVDALVLRSKVRVFLDLYSSRQRIAGALTELRQTNEELERAHLELKVTQTQLVQSAKLASLGELVAGIAHEINNPLAFALSHLDTIHRSLHRVHDEIGGALSQPARDQWSRATDRLSETRGGLERIRDLVVKLRTFSRLDEGERKRVNVKESIESVLTIFGHRLGERIRVHLDLGPPDFIECYPAVFNQALANLVSNAIDAMPGEGTLSVVTELEGDLYSIRVSDTGPGIPKELRARVLEPFFTTKPVGQGTGLGLSITYGTIKKHGGTLEIGDAEQGGAEVTIRIPLTGQRVQEAC